ncbi:MAG: hypothetical protein IKN63_02765 [Bacilli bacterium]|nr:hypothetical protein [Bacilli bacterium]
MKKIEYILILIIILNVLNVKAIGSCTTDQLNHLKELANNVELKKIIHVDELNQDEEKTDDSSNLIKEVYYTIEVVNYDENLIIYYKDGDTKYKMGKDEIDNFEFYEDENAIFNIYSYTSDGCTNDLLRTISLNFDYYNMYYYDNKDKCIGHEDFKYCQEYLNINDMDYKEIDKLYEEYIANKSKKTSTDSSISNISFNKYYLIGGISLIIVSMLIILIIKKVKKNKL